MVYRVIRVENGSSRTYDFDDVEDAREWIRQEVEFDQNSMSPKNGKYDLIEVER